MELDNLDLSQLKALKDRIDLLINKKETILKIEQKSERDFEVITNQKFGYFELLGMFSINDEIKGDFVDYKDGSDNYIFRFDYNEDDNDFEKEREKRIALVLNDFSRTKFKCKLW